jgi:GTP cyclohydrolase I
MTLDIFASRLQVQERLTEQVVQAIEKTSAARRGRGAAAE